MIQRYQRMLFIVLLGSSVLMAAFLIYLRRQAYGSVQSADDVPIEAPSSASAEPVTLDLADDSDGSITPEQRSLALPAQPAVRARALLEHLLAEYALPHTKHPMGGGIAVDDVFLVALPLAAPVPKLADTGSADIASAPGTADAADPIAHGTGELAVVNLRSAWADAHPSGITVETLTIRSVLGTLHSNLPEITEVRFLVDGQPRATLAGNVALDRVYDVVDTSTVASAAGASR